MLGIVLTHAHEDHIGAISHIWPDLKCNIYATPFTSVLIHEKFKEKQTFPFELLSDPDEKMCKSFDVMTLKSMYGREYMGVDRSTFLVNEKGNIVKEWRSVKVKGHVDDVINEIEKL